MNWLSHLSHRAALFVLVFALTVPPQAPQPVPQPDEIYPFHQYVPYLSSPLTLTPVGPEGGSITALVINPQNTQEMYAGTFGGGVYKTENGGATWQSASWGLIDGYIQSLAIDPKTPATVYAGMYTYGVYKTTDGGATWSPTGPGLNHDAIVYDLQVDPLNPNNVYAGTRSKNPVLEPPWGGGVFKSTNGGETWTEQNNGLIEDWVYSLAIDPTNPSIIYAALHTQGISKSTDGAATWTTINSGLDDTSGRSVVIDPLNPQNVYFATWHYGQVFKSTNGGTSWQAARNGLPGIKVYKLFVDPVDPNIVYAGSYLNGLYKSTNGGVSWGAAGFANEFITTLAVDAQNHGIVFAGTSGAGLFRSTNTGGSWSAYQNGLRASLVSRLAKNSNYLFTSLMGEGLVRSPDGGATWQAAGAFGHYSVNTVVVNPSNSMVIYAATDRIGVLKTTDGGNSWNPVNTGLASVSAPKSLSPAPQANSSRMDIAQLVLEEDVLPEAGGAKVLAPDAISYSVLSLAFDPRNPMNVYIGTNPSGVFKSTTAGASWSASGLGGKAIYALAADPNRPLYVYAGTDGPGGSLWKSTDGGGSWSQANGGLQDLTVYDLLIDERNTDHLYAATSAGVFKSSNAGGSWQSIGLAEKIAYSLALTPDGLYAGTRNGLYLTADDGASWVTRSGDAIFLEVHSLLLDDASGTLFAGTNGQGVQRVPR